MESHLSDRLSIADLMTGWIHRDLGEWDKLRELFHPEGTIEITWFEGKASDFVDASIRMAASYFKTKHVITAPLVIFQGAKAIVETNVIVVGENIAIGLGCSQHCRFYDRVEKRNGIWKILNRQCIYDMGSFTFSKGLVEIDGPSTKKYPREYVPLAYLLEKSGFPLSRIFATTGSDLERMMKESGNAWLAS